MLGLLDDTVFCYAAFEISRIHTTLEILLFLQTKVTKNCCHQMGFLGSNATQMRSPRLLAKFQGAASRWEREEGRQRDKDGGKESKERWGREESRGRKGIVMSFSENSFKNTLAPNAPIPVFGQGFAPDPAGGA